MKTIEAQLLRRLRQGDRTAFEAVVEEHYQPIFRQLWHLCGDEDTAADLTQETFVQAWGSLPRFEGRSTLRTWLSTIAVRAWIRWKSGHSSDRHVPLDELADNLPDPACDPAGLLEVAELHQAVRAVLHGLPGEYRETLVLFYLQELKYREIAEALAIPIGTVKSRLHAGLARLKTGVERLLGAEVVRCE